MIAEPLALEDRPQLVSAVSPRPNRTPTVIELRPAEAFDTSEASPLTMARVTSSLQLILAARRAARVQRAAHRS